MGKPEAEDLRTLIEEAMAAGARPGDDHWQPRIDRAWRRALDAGIRCHIHTPGPGLRWVMIVDVAGDELSSPDEDDDGAR